MSSTLDVLKNQFLTAERAKSAPAYDPQQQHAEDGFHIALKGQTTFDPGKAALGPTHAARGPAQPPAPRPWTFSKSDHG